MTIAAATATPAPTAPTPTLAATFDAAVSTAFAATITLRPAIAAAVRTILAGIGPIWRGAALCARAKGIFAARRRGRERVTDAWRIALAERGRFAAWAGGVLVEHGRGQRACVGGQAGRFVLVAVVAVDDPVADDGLRRAGRPRVARPRRAPTGTTGVARQRRGPVGLAVAVVAANRTVIEGIGVVDHRAVGPATLPTTLAATGSTATTATAPPPAPLAPRLAIGPDAVAIAELIALQTLAALSVCKAVPAAVDLIGTGAISVASVVGIA